MKQIVHRKRPMWKPTE